MYYKTALTLDWNNAKEISAKDIAMCLYEAKKTDNKQIQDKFSRLSEKRTKSIEKEILKLLKSPIKPTEDETIGAMRFYLGDLFQELGGSYILKEDGTIEYTCSYPTHILSVEDAKIVAKTYTDILGTALLFDHTVTTPWQNKNHKRTNQRASIADNLADGYIYEDQRPTYEAYWSSATKHAYESLINGNIPKKRAKELSSKIITIIKTDFKK
jgi:hypothetical protein